MKQNPEFSRAIILSATFVALLWLIEGCDRLFNLELYRFGVFPRDVSGLAGILFGPLLHGSWGHLIANSSTLLVLVTVLLFAYPRSARWMLLLTWLGSGLGVWLFARASYHFGASGLTHGMMFYIFVSGILRHDRQSIALSMIVFFLYGSMVWGIFPQEQGISYETHFFGALCGVVTAFLFRNLDPLLPEKHYDWEDEESDEEKPGSDPGFP
jgi:membrane associated rhomboid family serine protease